LSNMDRKQIIAFDFDGVMRIYPVPFRWFFDFVSPTDILLRAHLGRLRGLINKFLIENFPLILNTRLINCLNQKWEGPIFLVSGRCTIRDQYEATRALRNLVRFHAIFFRERCSEYEEKFKERYLKKVNALIFVEDRPFVRQYISKRTKVRAISPSEFLRAIRS
jgi:hypothetical protein